jgi:hypothetical protein
MPATTLRREQRTVQRSSTAEAAKFVDQLKTNSVGQSGTFDSAAATDFLSDSTVKIPDNMQVLFDEVGGESATITKAILDGISIYESEHGVTAPADIIESALHAAYGTSNEARRKMALDSASNAHGDNLSLQPNRAVVAILSALSEAIPFAHYLPADISSNEARLAILTHQAGGQYGMYAASGIMDGVASGDPFITSSRTHTMTVAATGVVPAGLLTSVQTDRETCAAIAGNVVAVKLLRGRSQVYVNGQVVAREVTNNQSGSGISTISGSVIISGTTYQIGGTINPDTGDIALTSASIPIGTKFTVEGFIDYERLPGLTPSIITNVDTFYLYAKPWRVTTQNTIDSQTQMSNELGLDPYSESIIAIQNQFANERHYEVLAKAFRIALLTGNVGAFDMAWSTQGAQKTRADVLQDLQAVIGQVSQQMAINTLGHGVTHLYVGKYLAAQMMSMPSTVFQPSGLQVRAGVFRIGRLFGQYDVYYTPKILVESASASQMLCIGRANEVTRNPFVLGDAVPPTVIPLAVGTDLRRGAGFYARNFTEVNPHAPSALGCALINVTNMGM